MQDFSRYTLSCTSCAAKSRVYFVDIHTQPKDKPTPTRCPGCGAFAVALTDEEQDYWDMMAEAYTKEFRQDGTILKEAMVTADTLKVLFEMWEPLKQFSYGEFIRKAMLEPDFLDSVMAAA